jgi:hypothetical protein
MGASLDKLGNNPDAAIGNIQAIPAWKNAGRCGF